MSKWVNEWTNESTSDWMNERVSEWVNKQTQIGRKRHKHTHTHRERERETERAIQPSTLLGHIVSSIVAAIVPSQHQISQSLIASDLWRHCWWLTHESVSVWMSESVSVWMSEWMSEWMIELMSESISESVSEWMSEWVIYIYIHTWGTKETINQIRERKKHKQITQLTWTSAWCIGLWWWNGEE